MRLVPHVVCSGLFGDKSGGYITKYFAISMICPFVLVNQIYVIIGSLAVDIAKPFALIFLDITSFFFSERLLRYAVLLIVHNL